MEFCNENANGSKTWKVYLDNAATTPVTKDVFDAMRPYLMSGYGNPSSLYKLGREARSAVERAREQVAVAINAAPHEIFFTSGGSESDNWAIKGTAFAMQKTGRHIITSQIEHHAVLNSCRWLEDQGFSVTYLPVDGNGIVDPEDVRKAIRNDTILISIMTANNEIGTIQQINEIGRIARDHGKLFHTDAVQAIGAIGVNVKEMCTDMLSISGHKFHAPKGIGALYIKDGLAGKTIFPLIHGGSQENGERAGTENVASIVGLGKAIELATSGIDEKSRRIKNLRLMLWKNIQNRILGARLNGHIVERLPNNLHISIPGVDAESLLLELDRHGISASAGSACTSGWLEPSHVLKAIGLSDSDAWTSFRLTIGDDTTEEDIEYTSNVLCEAAELLSRAENDI